MDLLALGSGTWLVIALVIALYVLVVWVILEILFRPDFGWGMKIAWIAVALLASVVAVPIWFLWVRNKDYSRA